MKEMKKIRLLLAMVILLAASGRAAGYSGGDGSVENPYQIETAADMNEIGANSSDWNSHFVMVADISLAGYTGTQFNIIGNENNPFTGVFDGNDHTIYYFTYTTTDVNLIGIFGVVDGPNAEIKDMTLILPNINAGSNSTFVGSLVGAMQEGLIEDCGAEGGSVSGGDGVGGLVGFNFGTISNCHATASVSGRTNVGGLAGFTLFGTISNCHATGSVDGIDVIGGLVGFTTGGTISNCYGTASVSGRVNVGGLVGYDASTPISDCYATDSVSGGDYTGGLVGYNQGATISNCYATGGVSGSTSPDSNGHYTGGLVGKNDSGEISNCYATGPVSGIAGTGGLVAMNDEGYISNCYATGGVSATFNQIGGLVGYNYQGTMIAATIANCYATGSVSGNNTVGYDIGGLVGLMQVKYEYSTISNCYATGSVSGANDVGGLVGDRYGGTISASFWDIETTGQSSSAGGTPKTTVQMMTKSTFTDAGWDFQQIWGICENQSYPYLRWVTWRPDFDYTITITATSGGTTEPNVGTHSYSCSSSVEVNAIPEGCYEFVHWELDGYDVGPNNPYSVVMDSNHALHAVFFRAKACFPFPADGAEDVATDVVLSWMPGVDANSHDVYFGTDFDDVNDANASEPNVYKGRQDANEYDPCGLELCQTYYWRIDQVNDANVWKGDVWSFTTIGCRAYAPSPENQATDVAADVVLSWAPARWVGDANGHDVYFGNSWEDVNDANTSDLTGIYQGNQDVNSYDTNDYDVNGLELGTAYYWRIDEVNDGHPNSPWKGDVWSFTTVNYLIVDDFDSYASTEELRLVWDDGLVNGTDSEIFLETDANFTRDGNSMRYEYTNATTVVGKPIGSAVDADPIDLESGRDWTAGGVKALVLYFLGDPCTVISELGSVWPWLELEDTNSNTGWVMYPDPNHVTEPTWHEWNIELAIFDACGVALSSIERLTIGIGGSRVGQTSKASTTNRLWFDDIRLYIPRCRPELVVTDLTGDCIADYPDLRIMSEEWLSSGIEADIVDDDNVNFLDYGLLGDNWLAEFLWPEP